MPGPDGDNKQPLEGDYPKSEADDISSQKDFQGLSSSSSAPESSPASEVAPVEDRVALLDKARAFLASPHIIGQDVLAKRQFLEEKGLNGEEVDTVLKELLPQSVAAVQPFQALRTPSIPPRTYPVPPPSNLPNLLLGLFRLLSWLTGSAAFLVLVYRALLLPRITQSSLARRALKFHQVSLLQRLNESLTALKSKQRETLQSLPSPPQRLSPEDAKYKDVHNLDALNLDPDATLEVPPYTLLRCSLEGVEDGKGYTKEDLFEMLESRYTWLKTEDGGDFLNELWTELTTNSCFHQTESSTWIFSPPLPSDPTGPLVSSLTSLKQSLPDLRIHDFSNALSTASNPYQHTLDALTDFAGYITTQTYALSANAYRVPGAIGMGITATLGPQEEEIRKEIRALKRLVLNRRAFTQSPARSSPPLDSSVTPSG